MCGRGEKDMGEVNAPDSWAEEQGGLAGTSSFLPYSVWADDRAYSEDGQPRQPIKYPPKAFGKR